MIQKNALVTGAAVRIGATIAERLAKEGYGVAIHCNRSVELAEALAERLRKTYGVKTFVISADLSQPRLSHVVEESARALGGPLTLLVNSASIYERDLAETFRADIFDLHMHVNLRAPILLTQAFADQAPEGSCVINMLDQRVLRSTPRHFSYTLSKNGLHAATKSMALSYGPRVRVNGIAPGLTLPNDGQDKEDYYRRAKLVPLQTGGSPEEVADAVMFFASAGSVTGQTIATDGGQHIAWQTPEIRK